MTCLRSRVFASLFVSVLALLGCGGQVALRNGTETVNLYLRGLT